MSQTPLVQSVCVLWVHLLPTGEPLLCLHHPFICLLFAEHIRSVLDSSTDGLSVCIFIFKVLRRPSCHHSDQHLVRRLPHGTLIGSRAALWVSAAVTAVLFGALWKVLLSFQLLPSYHLVYLSQKRRVYAQANEKARRWYYMNIYHQLFKQACNPLRQLESTGKNI